jgi:hypothetical protein
MAMTHWLGSFGHDPSARNFGTCCTVSVASTDAVFSDSFWPHAIVPTIPRREIAIV